MFAKRQQQYVWTCGSFQKLARRKTVVISPTSSFNCDRFAQLVRLRHDAGHIQGTDMRASAPRAVPSPTSAQFPNLPSTHGTLLITTLQGTRMGAMGPVKREGVRQSRQVSHSTTRSPSCWQNWPRQRQNALLKDV